MSYRLTDNEVTDFAMAANDYVKLERPYTEILPVKRIKNCYIHKWYVSTEVESPQSSKDGREGLDVRAARTEGEANVISFVYTYEIPRAEVEMAQNAGVPIWAENIGAGLRKMNDKVCRLIFRGTNTWDKVAILGMHTRGTAELVGLDAIKFNTATGVTQHAAAGLAGLTTGGYDPPYNWALGVSLHRGFTIKYGAGDPAHWEMMEPYGLTKEAIKFYSQQADGVAETRYNTTAMGMPVDDDAMWFFYKKDPNYAYLAEVMPITTTINPELDIRRQCYHARIEWRGTVVVVQPTSIIYEAECDHT